MPKKKSELDRIAETMDKLLALQLWSQGVSQEKIAKTVGRKTEWVNGLLKGIPKGGQKNAGQEAPSEVKKASTAKGQP